MNNEDDRAIAQEILDTFSPGAGAVDRARVHAMVAYGVKRGRLAMVEHGDAVISHLRSYPQSTARDVARVVFAGVGATRTRERRQAMKILAELHCAGYVTREGSGTTADPYLWSLAK